MKAISTSGVLYTNVELVENIQVWLSAMSAAQNRPFRHTATVVSLAIVTALCEVGSELLSSSAKSLRHSESEKKSKKVNKGRVSGIQEEAQKAQQKQALLDTLVKDWFDTIFIHRYRDVDPRIRVDCAQALGQWILTYPDMFFDSSHLRYLGWVLSDPYPAARHEVIKQLQRLFNDKDRLAGLKTFTERFRSRIVEMATSDGEASVRAAAVELLDSLRAAGFLEPDDIDAVGRLIFDAEPRVRKAVVGFFNESINDSYESKIEDLGGEEAIEEDLGESATSTDKPNLDWLRLKCLAEMLESYDGIDSEMPQDVEHGHGRDSYRLHAGPVESRFIIAADSLFSQVESIQDWETLAGYLLYDTSDDAQNGTAHGIEAQLRELVRLNEKEEIILLEVLNASVKGEVARLIDAASEKKAKKTKKQRDDIADEQERAARQLTNLIPRLLKRFGDVPQTASAVLRLERIVNLEAFEDFSQDSSSYTRLLDDINKQFLSHGDEEVLTEASRALLRAKDYQDLGEVTDEKIDELWEGTISTFTTLIGGQDLSGRGNLSTNVVDALNKTVSRLDRLASISRPISHLETTAAASKGSRKNKVRTQPDRPIDSLINLTRRAIPITTGPGLEASEGAIEDILAINAASTVSFYFMWTIAELQNASNSASNDSTSAHVETFTTDRASYISALKEILNSRSASEDISSTIAGLLLDAHNLSATLRQTRNTQEDATSSLALEMDAKTQKQILKIFTSCEESFARKTDRKLESAPETKSGADQDEEEEDINAEPMDEDEPLSSSASASEGEEAEDETQPSQQNTQTARTRRNRKLQAQLLAEQRLCELAAKIVLSVVAGVMDSKKTRMRIERNRNRLGNNFKAVLGHLETKRGGRKAGNAGAGAGGGKKGGGQKVGEKSRAVVVESDEEDEDEAAEEEVPLHEEVEEEDVEGDAEPEAEAESVLGD